MLSALIFAVVVLLVIGVILWLINNYLPIDAPIKRIINIVVIIGVIIWLLLDVLLPLAGHRI